MQCKSSLLAEAGGVTDEPDDLLATRRRLQRGVTCNLCSGLTGITQVMLMLLSLASGAVLGLAAPASSARASAPLSGDVQIVKWLPGRRTTSSDGIHGVQPVEASRQRLSTVL